MPWEQLEMTRDSGRDGREHAPGLAVPVTESHLCELESQVRAVMPGEIRPDCDIGDYEARLERLKIRASNILAEMKETVDAELERRFLKSAEVVRKDPSLVAQIRQLESEVLEYLRAEIEEERKLIALFL
jgi:hypothetical protein